MKAFRFIFPLTAMLFCGTLSGVFAEPSPDKSAPQPETDVRVKVTIPAGEGKEIAEIREAVITAEKPGFVHLWHYYGDKGLNAPLLPAPDGKSYQRTIIYEARDTKGGVFSYRIVPGPGEVERATTVELWNWSHVSYGEFAKGMRDAGDPSGRCLRGVPLDLVPFQTEALLMEVTDGPEMSQMAPWSLHLWHPTYYSMTKLPTALEQLSVQVGYLITTPGETSSKTNPPSGQKVGRVSQRDGKLVAHLRYEFGSSSGYDKEVTPEEPFKLEVRAFSGAIYPVVGVLSKEDDATPFLLDQLKKDMKGTKWEAKLKEPLGE